MAISKDQSPSIITLRLEDEKPANVNKRLRRVLMESLESLKKGCIITVEEKKHRVRLLTI